MIGLERLARWEKDLDKCIRCGYCYEHCPLFKATRWETDTPRGKLVLLSGLLRRQLEPSAYLAEKIFSCFHCRRCEKVCSSGVKPLDIFAAARADLWEAGLRPAGTVSATDQERCARCLTCVRVCPHEARAFCENQVITDAVKCQGCGSCLDACPAQAITINGFGTSPGELSARLGECLPRLPAGAPRVVTFACSWSSHPGFQSSRLAGDVAADGILITACSGRLTGSTVLEAFELGAGGVLVAGCREEDCQHGGGARAERRLRRLRALLEKIGLEKERLELVRIGFADPAGLSQARADFVARLKALGPRGGT